MASVSVNGARLTTDRTAYDGFPFEIRIPREKIAGNGTGDTRWKVPGVLDWSTSIYNPNVDISKDTTTLYASDRDIFVFLVDDLNPCMDGSCGSRVLDRVW